MLLQRYLVGRRGNKLPKKYKSVTSRVCIIAGVGSKIREDSFKTHHTEHYKGGCWTAPARETALDSQKQHPRSESAFALLLPGEGMGQFTASFSAFLRYRIQNKRFFQL